MKTSYRKLKRDINKYNKTVESANKLMNKMMKGGLMEYMDGGHVNPAAAMFGANSQKISNMSSPLHGVNTARLQLGYPKAAYGMSMDTYGMGGYSPSFSVPQGQMGMPVKTETNDAGMSYAIPVMYQEGGEAMPNSQDMAMAMAQQEGAPMPPMQPGMEQGMEQPMPEQQPQQDEQMMQQLVQLAQAALAGDEQAIQMIQQLPPEQQQIILQIMEEMEAQGGQPMPQAAPEQGMEPGMEPGMEQGMMMYGGIMNATNKSSNMMKKKKKSNKSKSNTNKMMMGGYTKRKTSMKKMNKLYNSLGIPC